MLQSEDKKRKTATMNINYDATMQNEAAPCTTYAQFPFSDEIVDFVSSDVMTIDDGSKTHQKQRVRFHDVECTYLINNDVDNTITQIDEHLDGDDVFHSSDLWYQTEDFKRFRSEDKKLMRVYRNLIKRKQRIPIDTIDEDNMNFINEQIEKLEDEIRGLEDYKSVRANIDFKHRRHACCYAVMKEQARQRKLFLFQKKRMRIDDETTDDIAWITSSNFELDATAIRNSVLDTSMKSKLLAFTLGLSDASHVRQMCTIDDTMGSIVQEEEEVNENFNENDPESCIKDVNEQRMYMKVPPRYEDVDDSATVHPVSRCNTISPISSKKATASSILRNLQLRHLIIQTPYVSCA
jgi:hypothetical protein